MKSASIFSLLISLLLMVSCSGPSADKPAAKPEKSEVQQLIEHVVRGTFLSWDDSFFALKTDPQSGAPLALVQFKEPKVEWRSVPPDDTDRLNGILDRGDIYLTYAHIRTYELGRKEWSLWRDGNRRKGIGGAFVAGISGPITSQWRVRVTKIDESWEIRPHVPYLQDTSTVRKTMKSAGILE